MNDERRISPIFETITTPTLLLNRERAVANIQRMAARARHSGVRFRPHFKTHQSAVIGEWFRQARVSAITVSSVSMAGYFARHGWTDITIAFPVNLREIEAINRLAGQVRLGLLVEAEAVVSTLSARLAAAVDVWLKVDVGYGRTGVDWADGPRLEALARQVEASPRMALRGLLTHAGHSYRARGQAEVAAVYRQMVHRLAAARDRLNRPGLELSIGDTPTCSLVDDLSAVDEIRPGNFVFFDVMQCQIGACREEEIAVAAVCPVVAVHPEQGKAVIYGGAVHLSKEFIVDPQGRQVFGWPALPAPDGWGPRLPGGYVSGLSQEHGLVRLPPDALAGLHPGDLLVILPVHSCLTANLLRTYHTLDGETFSMLA